MGYIDGNNSVSKTRQYNLDQVRAYLKQHKSCTRLELAEATELSIATCRNLITELLEKGEVIESGYDSYTKGRPAMRYSFNMTSSFVAGVLIDAENETRGVEGIVADLQGNILMRMRRNYSVLDLSSVSDFIGDLMADYPLIKSIGIGVPGITDSNGIVLLNDIPELNGAALGKHISCRYEVKVNIKSTPKIMAYGYAMDSRAYGEQVVASIVAPAGHPIGAGVVIGGKIYDGDSNIAGEIGYIDSDEDFEEDLINAIVYMVRIIDPSAIILTGRRLTPEIVWKVKQKCKRHILAGVFPKLVYKADAESEYTQGVIGLALSNM